MLEYAKKHEDELKKIFNDIAFDLYYQFAFCRTFREEISIPDNTHWQNDFVSVNKDKIIGYINYNINRTAGVVYDLQIIHFGADNSYTFTKDILTAIDDIFEKYKFNKIKFDVIVGNPIEPVYDRLMNEFGGRIVGINKKDIKLLDGNIYDIKHYELFSEDYFKSEYYQRFKKRKEKNNG